MTAPAPVVEPPVRVCPHCAAQSRTFGKKCPNCGKKFRKRGFFGKLVVVVVVLLVLLALGIGGCAALISGGASAVQKASDEHSITPAQYAGVKSGATLASVKSHLGTPSDSQSTEVQEVVKGAGGLKSDCIYYNEQGELASLYQFCFDNGKLSSKASY